MLLQQRECEAVEPREVLPGMPVADPGLVFTIRDVQAPVAGVFDAPMTAHGSSELLHSQFLAADVITCFNGFCSVSQAATDHHADRSQPFPVAQAWQVGRGRQLDVGPCLFSPVPLVMRGLTARRHVGDVILALRVDVLHHRIMQRLLVGFERQDEVGFALDNLSCNGFLRPHRVEGDDGSADVDPLQEFGNRCDFIGFLGTGDLPQTQSSFAGSDAHSVECAQTMAAVMAAADRLAVNGHHRPINLTGFPCRRLEC